MSLRECMSLRERLVGVLPQEQLAGLSNRFHVIGDIAILSLGPELIAHQKQIGEAVIASGGGIRTVLNRTSKLSGERRIASYEVIAGIRSTVTAHWEFGFLYSLDVSGVFFSSRLGYERMRVAKQVGAGEMVLVLFAGVGPFVIPIAARGASVFAVEKSRQACLYLYENARRNRVAERISILNADAFSAPNLLRSRFSRAVLPAPYGAGGVLEAALPLVISGGAIHLYTFKRSHQIEALKKGYSDLGLDVQQVRRCGNVAPGVSRWAFDLRKP